MKPLVSALRGPTRTQAKTPVPYASRYTTPGMGGLLTPTGTENQIRAVGANSTLFAIVDAYATGVAGVTWDMYRQPPPGAPEGTEPETAPGHPALWLWNNPNQFYSRPRLVKSVQQHIELVGEGILVVVKTGSLPYELWCVRPDRMEPVPHPEKFLAGWIYHGPDGQLVPLGVDQVIQLIRTPCPWDAYRGMGAVATILTDLYGDAAAAEWHRSFFKNSARPDGVIEVPVALSDTEWGEFQERWRETHQGVNNAFRVAMLEHGSKWVSTAYSMHDMQFIGLRAASHEHIRGAFRMPETVLGRGESLNRATAEAQLFLFSSGHIVPRLNDWRDDALNFRLLPMYGPTGAGVAFGYANPTPEDQEAKDRRMTSQATAFELYARAGADPGWAAEVLGLPAPRMAPQPEPEPARTGTPPAPTKGKPPPKALPPAAHTSNGHHRVTLAFGRHPQRAALPRAADGGDEDDAPDLTGVREDLDEALEALEAAWEPIQARWVDTLVEQVEAAAAAGDFGSLDVGDTDEAADVIRAALAGMARTARDRAVRELAEQGVTVDPPDLDEGLKDGGVPLIVNFGGELIEVARVLAELLGGEFSLSAAREALRLWQPGVKARELASRVQEFLKDLTGASRREQFGAALRRATNVARLVAQSAGLKARPTWKIVSVEVLDDATCTNEDEPGSVLRCREVDGTEYASVADAWADYGTGVYRWCKGRWRCRGTTRLRPPEDV